MKASKVFEHSAEGAVVGSSNDLLPLILINLPIKSLVRFQSVSKQWKFIICDDQDLGTKHSRNSSSSPCGVFLNPYFVTHEATEFFPLFENPSGYAPSLCFLNGICDDLAKSSIPYERRIVQRILSCNGLLLCIFSLPFLDDNQKPVLVVCNPTTKRFKVLPQIGKLQGFTLVFSPSESPHYRVVALKCYSRRFETEIHMYSSETDRWELVHLIPDRWYIVQPRNYWVSNGVFSNGCVYWLRMDTRDGLLYYNLNSNDFGTLDLPPEAQHGFRERLVESCGRVFLVFDVFPSFDYQVSIYELDSSNMQWSFITQRHSSMVIEGICIPFESYHCEYIPSLAQV